MKRSLVAAALAGAALLLTACSDSTTETEKGTEMTQADARTHLEDVVRELLTAAAPDVQDGLSDTVEVPCGGLGGNEWNKVKYTLESIDGVTVPDRVAALAAAQARIEERGWEATPRGDSVDFSTGDVTGTVAASTNAVLVRAETECMDNAER